MERDRVIADRDPQPGAARAVFPAKFLTRQLVSSAWRSAALFWCEGSPRPAARAAARTASGCRPASPARPSALGRTSTRNAVHGAEAGTVRLCSRRASWGTAAAPRRHFHGRRPAGPAPGRTADHEALIVSTIRPHRPQTHASGGGLCSSVRSSSPGRSAVAGRAALLAARLRSERGLLLESALDSTAPVALKPLKLDFQRLDPVPSDVFAPLRRRAFSPGL